MQRSPSCSVTVMLRYKDFSVCSTVVEFSGPAPSVAPKITTSNNTCNRSECISRLPRYADSGQNRRNYRQRPDDLVDLEIEDEIERSRNSSRRAAERRNKEELARVAAAEPRLIYEQPDCIRRNHPGHYRRNKEQKGR